MRLTSEERKRLARNGYYAMLRAMAGDKHGNAALAPWDTVATATQNGICALVDSVAASLLPPGAVALPRDRAARLIELAELAHGWVNAPDGSAEQRRTEDALTHLVDAMQPGDYDPLPDPA